jgi:ATP-binding cassette subfamily B protein
MPERPAFSFFHRIRLLTALILLALTFEAALSLLIPAGVYFFAPESAAVHDRNSLYWMLIVLGVGATAGLLAGLLRDYLTARARSRALGRLRVVLFERLHRVSAPAEAVENIRGDLDAVESAIGGAVPRAALPLLQAILCAALMLWLDWRAGLAGLLFWPWIFLAPALGAAYPAGARNAQRSEAENLFELVRETIAALPVIRLFGLEQQGIAAFRKRSAAVSRSSTRVYIQAAFMERFSGAGVVYIHLALFAVSALLVFGKRMTMPAFAAIQITGFTISWSLLTLTGYLHSLDEPRKSWERIGKLLAVADASKDVVSARAMPPMRSEIGFSDVVFRYPGAGEVEGPNQIAGVTARIPQGAYVAFVGTRGAGKSTLLKLLMRICDPQSGRITMDGFDLQSATAASLRARTGMVPAENALMNVSIRDNIRLGKPEASAEAVVTAAGAVGLHEQIITLPRGYDTVADSSVRFSLGGLQRLALARAILWEPEILLIDDATSALDPAEEVALQATIRLLRNGRTLIVAGHRLSTTADADHIFVLDNGAITEQGNHTDLLALEGMYTYLWHKQGGFRIRADGEVDVDPAKLKTFPVLECLDPAALAELIPFLATETFQAGREIVRQDDPGDKFYMIARGRAQSTIAASVAASPNGAPDRILEDGDCFGELSLLAGVPCAATVRALTVCTCVSLARGHFSRVVERFPESQRAISEVTVQRLRAFVKAAGA